MKNLRISNNQAGQVVVEYSLLLVVVVFLVMTVFDIIKDKIIFDPNRCNEQSINPICSLKNLTNAEGEGANKFRYFRLRR